MTSTRSTANSGPAQFKIVMASPFVAAPIALALLVATVVSLCAPYERFDVAAKIQQSMLHKPGAKTLRASY